MDDFVFGFKMRESESHSGNLRVHIHNVETMVITAFSGGDHNYILGRSQPLFNSSSKLRNFLLDMLPTFWWKIMEYQAKL